MPRLGYGRAVLVLALALCVAPPPTLLRAPVQAADVVVLRAEEGVLTATPCAEAPTCSGESVNVARGRVTLRLRRAGQREVWGDVEVTGSSVVRAPVVPDLTIETATATTAVAMGAALVATAVLIVALDAEDDATLRVGLPVAAGVGGAALVGGGIWLRYLDPLPEPCVPGAPCASPAALELALEPAGAP